MHYANGQEAKAGDLVIKPKDPNSKYASTETVGILLSAQSGSTSCNGQMQPLVRRHHSDAGQTGWMLANTCYLDTVTVGELLPLDAPEVSKDKI